MIATHTLDTLEMTLHNETENKQLETTKTNCCREIVVLLNIENETKSIELFFERHDEI